MDTQPPRAPAASNLPEYGVADLSAAIRRTLEGTFGRVRVRGEVTELKRYPSGHVYLSLKDADAKIEAVVWKTRVGALGLAPENGIEVVATGRVTTYGDRSKYQLSIDRLEYAGAGALLARIEALRLRLAAEGLFDEAARRPLPRLPAVIGVVTSPQGAVLHDIRTTLARRFPRPLLVWPVAVQGQGAAAQVAAAIAGFSALDGAGPVPRPDVLIVARGGGSLEDLMAFNDEAVVRAAAACTIPLISAVGHETDTTLIDFAADRRAPTPTAAAELAVPARADLLADLAQTAARLHRAALAATEARRLRLLRADRGLPDLPALAGAARQRLDDRAERLANAPAARLERARRALAELGARLGRAAGLGLERRRAALARAAQALPHPREGVAGRRAALALLETRARAAWARDRDRRLRAPALARLSPAPLAGLLRERRLRLGAATGRLEGASYQSVLARGFALVRGAAGEPVVRADAVAPGTRLTLAFADGAVGVVAEGAARPRPAGRPAPGQEALL